MSLQTHFERLKFSFWNTVRVLRNMFGGVPSRSIMHGKHGMKGMGTLSQHAGSQNWHDTTVLSAHRPENRACVSVGALFRHE